MNTVFIAGATGYLGRHLCAEYSRRGWYVTALVRDRSRARDLAADSLVEAQATDPNTLRGVMAGADLVVSALGITKQNDGLTYRDVDYQANLNLLHEALRAHVPQFAYAHVLNAAAMRDVPLVGAKCDFVDALLAADIAHTIMAPSGYFSDMGDFLSMARGGRVWLFGDGQNRINPIHGADLAAATVDATEARRPWVDIGGPDVFTHNELAVLAFDVLGRPTQITHLPDAVRRGAIQLFRLGIPRQIAGPARFFLTAMGMDMIGECYGNHRLRDHFHNAA